MEALEFERLNRLAAELRDGFRSAGPYPHVVIDDFLPVEAAEELAQEQKLASNPSELVWGRIPVKD